MGRQNSTDCHDLLVPDDFDAALVHGFRESTRAEYQDLDRAWKETSSKYLGPDGNFLDGCAQTRDCPLCDMPSGQARFRFSKLGMRIVTCGGCGMTYSRDVLREDLDRMLYLSSASQASYRRLKGNQSYAALESRKCRYLLQQIALFRELPGRLLDVGPGSGRFLQAALEADWQATGVEASPEFAAACRAAGIPVLEGFFPEVLDPHSTFDAITLLDVLEHAQNPRALLECVWSRLVPGGIALLQVPNMDSLLVHTEGAANSNFCHGHWNHFNSATLSAMAERTGFVALKIQTIISELDRILQRPSDIVAASACELTGAPPPQAGVSASWLHANRLGYKVVGIFRRPERDV